MTSIDEGGASMLETSMSTAVPMLRWEEEAIRETRESQQVQFVEC